MGDDVDLLLWFEDDVVLMENFFPTLTSILTHHTGRLARAPWLDIKLYLIPGLRGYAWDPQPLLELISTTALITMILHPTLNRIFLSTLDRRRSWLARLIVLFILVLLTLESISRYHLCPLFSTSILLQTTYRPVEENPPSALRMEASSRAGDCCHCLQQDQLEEDCLLSEKVS